jgi:ribosome-associated protein
MIDPRELALQAVEAAEGKKAVDVVLLDLRGLTTIADYFLICSGNSITQVAAIADGIGMALERVGQFPSHIEGTSQGTWVLMDYGDVVVHIFDEPTRAFYALERLWGDAPRIALTGKPAALLGASS